MYIHDVTIPYFSFHLSAICEVEASNRFMNDVNNICKLYNNLSLVSYQPDDGSLYVSRNMSQETHTAY